jgi:hypothetical protein
VPEADDTDDVSWLQSLLESRRPDPGPVVGRWALGIGDMVADHPLTPDKLRGLVRKLNHFGGVAISEEGVEFDGDKVKWVDVIEIRTRSLVEYLFTGGVDKQIDKLPLPWFPFRRKVIEAISRAALTLLLAAAKQQLEGGALDIRIPAEVGYRGMRAPANCRPAYSPQWCWPTRRFVSVSRRRLRCTASRSAPPTTTSWTTPRSVPSRSSRCWRS